MVSGEYRLRFVALINFAVMIVLVRICILTVFVLQSSTASAQAVTITDAATEAGTQNSHFSNAVQKPLPFELPATGIVNSPGTGRPLFSVNVKRGKLNGNWQSWFANGVTCDSGKLVNNLPDGEWVFRNEQGGIRSVRQYSADKFLRITNEMLHYHPKRSFYYLAALYQQNKRRALQFLDAGYSFPGSQSRKPVISVQQLVEENTSTGYAYQPVFVQCIHEGLYMNYFESGLVEDSGYYKDGMRTGKWIHRDTATPGWYQGAYLHDKRIKEWKHFDDQGRLTEIIHYRGGREVWRKKIKRG